MGNLAAAAAILVTDIAPIFLVPGYLDPATAADGLIWVGVSLIFALVGSLILARQPSHVVGWLLMVLPITAAVSSLMDVFFKETVYQATQLSIPQFLYLWFSEGWVGQECAACFPAICR